MLVLVLVAIALVASGGSPGTTAPRASASGGAPTPTTQAANGPSALPSMRLHSAPPAERVRLRFHSPPRAAILFDLDSGAVLWSHNPSRELPIASVTKTMTALLAAERLEPDARLRVSKAAVAVGGSKFGLLHAGKHVRAETMLYALMLPSGNDAAIVLAEAISGSVPRFVELMNERAQELGLTCTQFSSPHGLLDAGNHSCPRDLAVLTRVAMAQPRVAEVVGHRMAIRHYAIKGGKVFMYNHNPLLRTRYPGTTGLKTGYTDAAGQCLIATVRRGRHHLGVVLLHSPNTLGQSEKLLERGFAALRDA